MKQCLKKVILSILLMSYFSFCSLAWAEIATQNSINQAAKDWPKSTGVFIKNLSLSSYLLAKKHPSVQEELLSNRLLLRKQYLQKFFSPWFNPWLSQNPEVLLIEKNILADFQEYPGWLENRQKNAKTAIDRLAANMRLNIFPNLNINAITVNNVNLRSLPSDRPIFGNWRQVGEGYPFDRLQISMLKANSPVHILQVSKDGAWNFVVTNDKAMGWLPSEKLAYVSAQFIQNWRSSAQFVVALHDGRSLFDAHMHYYTKTRIGELFPVVSTSKNYYWLKLAVRNIEGDAEYRIVRMPKKMGAIFPLPASPRLVGEFINQLVGNPYGWGELYGYRDCSATMKDLFSMFGIWLPRSSADQANTGDLIDLSGLSAKQKLALIQNKGKPFFTLLSLPGHITLYLGEYKNQLWVFHDFWGVHTINLHSGKEGRAIMGQSLITPLTLGAGYKNVNQTLIDRVSGMTAIPSNQK